MNKINSRVAHALARLRAEKPLINHITNLVVMNDTANVTLHLGALPVMTNFAPEEAEMTRISGALLLNVGMIDDAWVAAMLAAGKQANALGIPIVLDPVGAGATKLRTETDLRLLRELRVQIVRGNAGEIGVLSGMGGIVKGVESVEDLENPIEAAKQLAHTTKAVVALSGKRDIITDGERVLGVDNGHVWLTTLTGTGCMATTAIACFAAVEKDFLLAATSALATYGLAAELAASKAQGPASFKVAFLDQLYHLTPEQVAEGARIVDLTPKAPGA